MWAELLMAAVTVGAPGNPPVLSTVGTVDYTFEAADTPVATSEFVAFLNQSQAPFAYETLQGPRLSFTFDGEQYVSNPGQEASPVVGIDYFSALRYVNWMATDGLTTESGAYELIGQPMVRTATFSGTTLVLNGVSQPAVIRTPGAKYYLPNRDEYIKANGLLAGAPDRGEYGESIVLDPWCAASRACYGAVAMPFRLDDGGTLLMSPTESLEQLGLRLYSPVPNGPVTLLGDSDVDGDLDTADLLGMLEDWTGALTPTPKWTSRSDMNRDGDVDTDDLLGLLAGWTGTAEATRSVAVPEPSGLVLVVIGSMMLRKRNSR